VTYFGALDFCSGIVTTMSAPTGDAQQFQRSIDHVADRWPNDHLVLVLDNASYHKTASLRSWFSAHADRISVQWLPTYSPQLNLIERVWGFAKAKLACHRLWNDLEKLTTAAQRLFDGTRATFTAPTYPRIIWRQDLCESA